MKIKIYLLIVILLTACQPAIPESITGVLGTEITLTPYQTVIIEDAGMSIRLIGVEGDERCPSEIECTMSGPVSLTLSVQKDSGTPVDLDLQTFTSNNGRSPEGQFEGIKSRIEYEGYIIRITSVLPYPARKLNEIKDSQYRVSFFVTRK